MEQPEALLLDLDGTCHDKEELIDGARGLIANARTYGMQYRAITNSSVRSPKERSEYLHEIGLDILPEHIITSSSASVEYVKSQFGQDVHVLLLTNSSMITLFEEAGFTNMMLPDAFHQDHGWGSNPPEVVLVGRKEHFDIQTEIDPTIAAISNGGAQFLATNDDRTQMTPEGFERAGTGFGVAGIQHCTRVTPYKIGKPNSFMLKLAVDDMDVPPNKIAFVGDNIDTDMGSVFQFNDDFDARMQAWLVETGVKKTPEQIQAVQDRVRTFPSIRQVLDCISV